MVKTNRGRLSGPLSCQSSHLVTGVAKVFEVHNEKHIKWSTIHKEGNIYYSNKHSCVCLVHFPTTTQAKRTVLPQHAKLFQIL